MMEEWKMMDLTEQQNLMFIAGKQILKYFNNNKKRISVCLKSLKWLRG